MPNQHIRCSIDNCHYWGQGNQCNAQEIVVTSNAMADALPDPIDAPQADQLAQSPVNKCTESCCKTFVVKGAYDVFADGVRKQ